MRRQAFVVRRPPFIAGETVSARLGLLLLLQRLAADDTGRRPRDQQARAAKGKPVAAHEPTALLRAESRSERRLAAPSVAALGQTLRTSLGGRRSVEPRSLGRCERHTRRG